MIVFDTIFAVAVCVFAAVFLVALFRIGTHAERILRANQKARRQSGRVQTCPIKPTTSIFPPSLRDMKVSPELVAALERTKQIPVDERMRVDAFRAQLIADQQHLIDTNPRKHKHSSR